jgi:hypothetical protein
LRKKGKEREKIKNKRRKEQELENNEEGKDVKISNGGGSYRRQAEQLR